MPPIHEPWFLSLIGLLALCVTSPQKLRTWAAITVGSVLAWYLPPVSVAGYLVLDVLSAALVLRRPAGLAQRVIGLLFALLILFHSGFALSDQQGWSAYYAAQSFVGWAQVLCLFTWGISDAWMAAGRRWFASRPVDRLAGL